jgi:hypothetical protein
VCAWHLQVKRKARIAAYVKRVMDEAPCESHEWAEHWLEEHGHIAAMLAGGWTLETVQDMPIAEVAKEMAAALWRGESMLELLGGKTAPTAPSTPLLTCCLPPPHLLLHQTMDATETGNMTGTDEMEPTMV